MGTAVAAVGGSVQVEIRHFSRMCRFAIDFEGMHGFKNCVIFIILCVSE